MLLAGAEIAGSKVMFVGLTDDDLDKIRNDAPLVIDISILPPNQSRLVILARKTDAELVDLLEERDLMPPGSADQLRAAAAAGDGAEARFARARTGEWVENDIREGHDGGAWTSGADEG